MSEFLKHCQENPKMADLEVKIEELESQRDTLAKENERLKAEIKNCEKVVEDRGYAFQNSVQKALADRDTWKAKAEEFEKGFSTAQERVKGIVGSLVSPDCHTTRCAYVNSPNGTCSCNLQNLVDRIVAMTPKEEHNL